MGTQAIFALFQDRYALEQAEDSLMAHGFPDTDISVMIPATRTISGRSYEVATKAPEGTVIGMILGMAIGGLFGWMAARGEISFRGSEILASAGTLVSIFAGLGVGAPIGGLLGALLGAGFEEYELRIPDSPVLGGKSMVAVAFTDPASARRARDILQRFGGKEVVFSDEDAWTQVSGERSA